MNHLPNPVFLVLEGLDGSRKSSVIQELAQRLDAHCFSTPLPELREVRPWIDSVFSDVPLASTCWYAVHVSAASQQAAMTLASGRSVVMDRYGLTTLAYSQLDDPIALFGNIARHWIAPFATIFLHPPFALRVTRLRARGALQPHDERSLTPAAELQLIDRYIKFSKHPIAGRFYDFRTQEHWTVQEIVDRILDLFFF